MIRRDSGTNISRDNKNPPDLRSQAGRGVDPGEASIHFSPPLLPRSSSKPEARWCVPGSLPKQRQVEIPRNHPVTPWQPGRNSIDVQDNRSRKTDYPRYMATGWWTLKFMDGG